MTRSRLSPPGQSLPLRILIALGRACASLRLAVVVITVYAVVLAWATVVESIYGYQSNAVHYGIYQTWWFEGLNLVLGLNVLFAVLVRFPWDKYLASLLHRWPGWLILGSFGAILWFAGHGLLADRLGGYGSWWWSRFGSWWAPCVIVLAALNVAYATVLHARWKRHQTGFLITHAGILVLLVGCWSTLRGGIDARLPVFEGESAWRALEDSQSLELTVYPSDVPTASAPPPDPGGREEPDHGLGPESTFRTIRVPFVAGPFNWDDYEQKCWFPWALARRDRGLVYHRDGIKLEVLDYYSDSREIPVPRLRLRTYSGLGPAGLAEDAGESVELVVKAARDPRGPHRRELGGGHRIVFWLARSDAEADAFLDSRPEGPLGGQGQIVLHTSGRKFHFDVDRLRRGSPQPLGETGWKVELVNVVPQLLGVQLQLLRNNQPPRRMILLADFPELSQHDHEAGIYGTYWFDPDAQRAEEVDRAYSPRVLGNARQPRIDVLQSPDGQLYHRAWKPPDVEEIGRLPTDGTRAVAFDGGEHKLAVEVEEFLPSRKPGTRMLPREFEPGKDPAYKRPQARIRLSVDGNREEFWLARLPYGVSGSPELGSRYRRVVEGSGRRAAVAMPGGEIDIGFRVYLQQFNRKLDPGSDKVSHYSSLVDFLDRHDETNRLKEDVLITLNAPVNFADPSSGRSYRLYQSSFSGPYRPGDPQFRRVVGGSQMRDRLFQSVLAVNYDPGRGVKYVGSLMICAGILTTFSMRSGFPGKKGRADEVGVAADGSAA